MSPWVSVGYTGHRLQVVLATVQVLLPILCRLVLAGCTDYQLQDILATVRRSFEGSEALQVLVMQSLDDLQVQLRKEDPQRKAKCKDFRFPMWRGCDSFRRSRRAVHQT